MSTTMIAIVTVNDDEPAALAAYFKVTSRLLEQVGATIQRPFQLYEVVVGRKPAKSVIIVEFPSREALDRVIGSPEYQAIIPTRDVAFLDYQICVAEE